MKVAMIFPTRESERAISGYSVNLTESMRKEGIDIEDITYVAGKPYSLIKKIPYLRKNYDIIHIQHEYNLLGNKGLPFFFVFFLLGCFKRNKIITTMHTALSKKNKFNENKLKTIFRKSLYLFQNFFIRKFSDKIVVHAKFFKDILMNDYHFSEDKISILPQGIIEDIKTLSKEQARKKFNLSGSVYLFIGSMIPDHGHDIIIKQADKIGPTILVVANPISVNDRNSSRTKSYLDENIEYVKNNDLSKFVRFDISDISDKKPEWWEYFSSADLVLLPYRGGIGSGIFAHAMAMKKPVIASNIQFFKEISENFDCVKIASTNEDYPALIKECMKKENYSKMIKGCENYFNKWKYSSLSKEYNKLYSS